MSSAEVTALLRRDLIATDPTAAPPGCPTGGAGDPIAQAYGHAAQRAQDKVQGST